MTDAPAQDDVRVVVAGTSGGVGTTTVAALLFDGIRTRPLGAPRLYDHAGGDLGGRLPHGDEVGSLDAIVSVHDAGRHAARIGLEVLDRPHDLLVVVAPRTPSGIADATEVMATIGDRTGTQGRRRTVLVLTAPFGPVRDAAVIDGLRSAYERRGVHALPRDPALAVGGRIATPRLSRPTRKAAHELAAQVADLIARHRASVTA